MDSNLWKDKEIGWSLESLVLTSNAKSSYPIIRYDGIDKGYFER